MGSCGSQEENNGDEVQGSFDPKNIYYDINGNLRFGIVLNDIVEEMRRMIVNDSIQEGVKTWYIIDSAWLSSWLYFAHYDKYISPCPGPCRNDELLTYSHSLQRWVPRKHLVMATKDRPGHYCKINKETWDLFRECYENSGPAIKVEFDGRSKEIGEDTSLWEIDQSECLPPPITEHDRSMEAEDVENIIKTEIAVLPSKKQQHLKKGHHDVRQPNPPLEFSMEDGTVTRTTIQEIQSFFGLMGSQTQLTTEEPGVLEHKYSSTLINSRSDEGLTSPKLPEGPKDANEAVSVWLFGENSILP